MDPTRISCSAKVQVTLEISNLGAWGTDCKIDQVYKQAEEEALGHLTRMAQAGLSIKVVGIPKVTAILYEAER